MTFQGRARLRPCWMCTWLWSQPPGTLVEGRAWRCPYKRGCCDLPRASSRPSTQEGRAQKYRPRRLCRVGGRARSCTGPCLQVTPLPTRASRPARAYPSSPPRVSATDTGPTDPGVPEHFLTASLITERAPSNHLHEGPWSQSRTPPAAVPPAAGRTWAPSASLCPEQGRVALGKPADAGCRGPAPHPQNTGS